MPETEKATGVGEMEVPKKDRSVDVQVKIILNNQDQSTETTYDASVDIGGDISAKDLASAAGLCLRQIFGEFKDVAIIREITGKLIKKEKPTLVEEMRQKGYNYDLCRQEFVHGDTGEIIARDEVQLKSR